MKLFELYEVLRFLAQSNDELVLYLPKDEDDLLYRRLDEDGFYVGVQMPSKAAGLTCLRVIHVQFTDVNDQELVSLISEIMNLLVIMSDMPIHAEYFWMVDKNQCVFTGPYDGFWTILRRLALQGLKMADAEVRLPQTPFRELIKLAGFSKWKVVPSSDD
jgi:hypothetical protein